MRVKYCLQASQLAEGALGVSIGPERKHYVLYFSKCPSSQNHCKTRPLGLLLESWHILPALLLGIICKSYVVAMARMILIMSNSVISFAGGTMCW